MPWGHWREETLYFQSTQQWDSQSWEGPEIFSQSASSLKVKEKTSPRQGLEAWAGGAVSRVPCTSNLTPVAPALQRHTLQPLAACFLPDPAIASSSTEAGNSKKVFLWLLLHMPGFLASRHYGLGRWIITSPGSPSPSLTPSEDNSYNWVLPLPCFLLVFAPRSPSKECDGFRTTNKCGWIWLLSSSCLWENWGWGMTSQGSRVREEPPSSLAPQWENSSAEVKLFTPSLLTVSAFGKRPVLSQNKHGLWNQVDLRPNPRSSAGSK